MILKIKASLATRIDETTQTPQPAGMTKPILHGYARSSASWRVRIGLSLKGIAFDTQPVRLKDGEQNSPAFRALNPQGLIPALEIDGKILTQSLAIIDYLEETRPAPALIPGDAAQRARIRAFALIIACDVHPIQNLKILERVKALTGKAEDSQEWARTTIREGLEACEANLSVSRGNGPFAFGEAPTLADILLVPQLANARRFKLDLSPYPHVLAVEAACHALSAFSETAPKNQPDFEN